MDLGINALGIVSLLATLLIAYLIFRMQKRDSTDWQMSDSSWKGSLDKSVDGVDSAVSELDRAIQEIAEEIAKLNQQQIDADVATEDDLIGDDSVASVDDRSVAVPVDESGYLAELTKRGIKLDSTTLNWRKKVRCDGGRGNLGWFVDDGNSKRYFVRRGRGVTVREAIPRELLEAWEKTSGKEPCEIEFDYQTGAGRGNHAWYINTYDGGKWKISSGGYKKTDLTVTLLEEA